MSEAHLQKYRSLICVLESVSGRTDGPVLRRVRFSGDPVSGDGPGVASDRDAVDFDAADGVVNRALESPQHVDR